MPAMNGSLVLQYHHDFEYAGVAVVKANTVSSCNYIINTAIYTYHLFVLQLTLFTQFHDQNVGL